MASKFNGIRTARRSKTIFVPLPRSAWEPIGSPCSCPVCRSDPPGTEPMWDTLALSTDPADPCTWTVHAPELHR